MLEIKVVDVVFPQELALDLGGCNCNGDDCNTDTGCNIDGGCGQDCS